MMQDRKNPGQKLVSADQMKEVANGLWMTLQEIVYENNKFLEQMQAANSLSAADEEKLHQWSKRVARAQKRVTDMHERLNGRQPGDALN